jgi:hypothetical protein
VLLLQVQEGRHRAQRLVAAGGLQLKAEHLRKTTQSQQKLQRKH